MSCTCEQFGNGVVSGQVDPPSPAGCLRDLRCPEHGIAAEFGIQRIISGAQTGADRGGLDAAIQLGIAHGGYCPKGRRSEDGKIPDIYQVTETLQSDYPPRTKLNIKEADVTLIFAGPRGPGTGSKLTERLCKELKKPHVLVQLDETDWRDVVPYVRRFLSVHRPKVVNVAGSRGSHAPHLQAQVRQILVAALTG